MGRKTLKWASANRAQRQKRQRLITAVGAAIGNVTTSVTATSASAGVSVVDHLDAVQRNQAAVKEDPDRYCRGITLKLKQPKLTLSHIWQPAIDLGCYLH